MDSIPTLVTLFLLHQFINDPAEVLTELRVIAVENTGHLRRYIFIILDDPAKFVDIFYYNDIALRLGNSLTELKLMIVDMFIKLLLSRNDHGDLSDL